MRINTRNFGEINIEDERILSFTEGIPGFQNCKQFALLLNNKEGEIENEESDLTFCWMQSIDDSDVAFLLLNTLSVMPDYNPLVNDDELESIGGFDSENTLVYNIVVVPEKIEDMRVNLKAPIVINVATKRGKQVIVNNDEYPIKYYIFPELQKRAGE